MQLSLGLILVAGGQGSRFGGSTPKQFLSLHGKPLALYSLETLLRLPIKECVIVCHDQFQHIFHHFLSYIQAFASPGSERCFSMINGFKKLSHHCSHVLIHDSARPFVLLEDIQQLIKQGANFPAATLATPIIPTIKMADSNQCVISTLDRKTLWEIQTPQLLQYKILQEGIELLQSNPFSITDDVSLAEHLGYTVKLIKGSPQNIKITLPFDFELASFYHQKGSISNASL